MYCNLTLPTLAQADVIQPIYSANRSCILRKLLLDKMSRAPREDNNRISDAFSAYVEEIFSGGKIHQKPRRARSRDWLTDAGTVTNDARKIFQKRFASFSWKTTTTTHWTIKIRNKLINANDESSVTRCWSKSSPFFSKKCPKSSQCSFYIRVKFFKIAQKLPIICAYFAKNFVTFKNHSIWSHWRRRRQWGGGIGERNCYSNLNRNSVIRRLNYSFNNRPFKTLTIFQIS